MFNEHHITGEEMNERVHQAAHSDWLALAVPIILTLVGIISGYNAWQMRYMTHRLDEAREVEAKYHERVDNMQTAQGLLSKLVDQLRRDVDRHGYQLDSIEDSRRKRDKH